MYFTISDVLLSMLCISKRGIYALLTSTMMCRELCIICAIFCLKYASVLCFYAFPSLILNADNNVGIKRFKECILLYRKYIRGGNFGNVLKLQNIPFHFGTLQAQKRERESHKNLIFYFFVKICPRH